MATTNKVYKNKHMSHYAKSKIKKLEKENTKLRIALCNLRDEYLDMGGDPNQLELFDKDDPSQLNLEFHDEKLLNDFEIEKNTENDDFEVKKIYESPDGGKTIYQRDAGSDEREDIIPSTNEA